MKTPPLPFVAVVVAVAALAATAAALGVRRDPTHAERAANRPEGDVAVTDAIGRTVRIPARPMRIVSLSPALTEILFAVGAGEQVVGVTSYCDHPPEAAGRTVIGGFADPSVERVVALRPDLVLATADAVSRDRFDAIVSLELTAFAVNPRDLPAIAATIRQVGSLTGHAAEGDRVAASFETRVRDVTARVAGKPRKRVLFLFDVAPPIAAGPNTFVDELVRTAGGENVLADAPMSYPRIGVEGIVAAAPDVVVTTVPGGAARIRALLADAGLRGYEVHELPADLLERPGPRLVEGLERLTGVLQPDAFTAGSPESRAP